MIDKNLIRENLRYYDKPVIVQIMDMFIDDYPIRFEELQKSIANLDFAGIDHNAHSLKGVVAYLSPEVFELARKLEQMGKNKTSEGLQEAFGMLKTGILELVEVLQDMRTEYTD